jgi:hypothetical protein
MAEQRKRGFGEFEKRIHELEEEHAKNERSTTGEQGVKREAGKKEQPRQEPPTE